MITNKKHITLIMKTCSFVCKFTLTHVDISDSKIACFYKNINMISRVAHKPHSAHEIDIMCVVLSMFDFAAP